MNTYCTIINAQYLPFAHVLYKSLAKSNASVQLQVLITDTTYINQPVHEKGFSKYTITEILESPIAKSIYKKYAATNNDHFRWALKPIFIIHLLHDFEKVIYIDPDIYFIGEHQFLFDELDNYSLLLSPHDATIDPLKNEDGLFSIMRNGLYSGGFVGATEKGKDVLKWWAEVCHYRIEKVKELGLYDDQKYLDLFPVLSTSCRLLRHKGCNLTNINIYTSRRELVNGQLLINGSYKPIFIHFTQDTINNIRNGNDPLLQHFLDEYFAALRNANAGNNITEGNSTSLFYKIKRKLLLRTRLKRMLYNLAENL